MKLQKIVAYMFVAAIGFAILSRLIENEVQYRASRYQRYFDERERNLSGREVTASRTRNSS